MRMNEKIAAIILAAGQSTRMGVSKMLLPWKDATVLDAVISLAVSARLSTVAVVTGAFHDQIQNILAAYGNQIIEIFNPHYIEREMFFSLKMAIQELQDKCDAAMIFLGDQPQISHAIVEAIIQKFRISHPQIILPSYNMRRGHPILIHQDYLREILSMPDSGSLKEFMNNNSSAIDYLLVDTREVLEDIDSPADYDRIKKNHLK